MAIYSDSSGSLPANDVKPGWTWLQAQIAEKRSDRLQAWLDEQLMELETQFAQFITNKSRANSVRSQLRNDKIRSAL